MEQGPRLSCKQCRQRKTKCNKGAPCSACKNAGLNCDVVQRARLPRGRSGKVRDKSTLLETRVARMEDLLKRVGLCAGRAFHIFFADTLCQEQGSTRSGDSLTVTENFNNPDGPLNPLKSAGQTAETATPDFWTALSQEVLEAGSSSDHMSDSFEYRLQAFVRF